MIPTLSEALSERGYTTLTDVQEAVTAPELAAADLLVSAQTGSGKTVGFGLAIASTLLAEASAFGPPAAPLALIVAPTRELAMQVARELEWLYAKTGAQVATCIGGMDARQERRTLERGAHMVVGTPGRLRDHIMRGALELGDIRAIVLDEADEMLDLGFREDLEYMLAETPASKRTLMFSATVPPAIAELAKRYQHDAVRVSTQSKGSQHADIAYQAIQVAQHDAEAAILNLLRFHDAQTAIVFANTRAAVARLTARLANRGVSVVSISGELSQDERSHALQALRDGRAKVCVATDVAARGIDLPNLELVVHADLPQNTEALLHRSGRTGRAGRKGISALIVPDRAANKAARLLKWAKISADWIAAPTLEDIQARDEARLLEDPLWTGAATEDEAAFATRLRETFTPEQIAVACLRLYRAGLSAPEELNTRPARAPAADKAPFGPSAWLRLSVGRAQKAEPRWLLPLLCRAGGLQKEQIGKIRVGETETSVEIAEAAMPGLLAALGPDGVLENDVRASRMENAAEAAASGAPAAPARPRRTEAPGAKEARTDSARPGRPKPAKSAPAEAPRASEKRPAPRRAAGDAGEYAKPAAPRAKAPSAPRDASGGATSPGAKPKPYAGRTSSPKGAHTSSHDDARASRKDAKAPSSARGASESAASQKADAKPGAGRAPASKGARTSHEDQRAPRKDAKSAHGPAKSKFAKSKAAKPAGTARAGAADPSQPMGKRRGSARAKARGGDTPPRRR
ncbi:ATP-dependent RNA helicase DeaD [Roseivivax lentus]|uniref:ATP-dependent RNA helicase DeaD n=1 Tax=Roseivivax lentus TaxID=633194 RepID=A0A1N7LQY0_9RHOB|nr:DEAD/DEAH box helicase [Roseivivax lentus]SIS76194.1 ATP-dependent RNA helicase DeaD [Roseivivax lentus]